MPLMSYLLASSLDNIKKEKEKKEHSFIFRRNNRCVGGLVETNKTRWN